MAVIVKYVVVRNGKEDMIFTTKKEADAYDKMLDIAERLYAFLQTAELDIADDQLDELTFFMAQHRDPISRLLKGGKLGVADADTKPPGLPKNQAEAPAPSDHKASEESKRPRATKPKEAA